MKKCHESFGICCCSCIHQIELFKHPWNKQFSGSCIDSTGLFCCIVSNVIDNDQKAIITDRGEHGGGCELHTPKTIRENKIERILK